MINQLMGWLGRRKRLRAEAAVRNEAAKQAVELARIAFADAYPDRQMLTDWLYVSAIDRGHIVTLLTPTGRPPSRSWWRVDATGRVVEIGYDEAARHIEMPVWR